MTFTNGTRVTEIRDDHPMIHVIRTYDELFSEDEKVDIALQFKGDAVDAVGREDLKRRLKDAVLKDA